LSHSAVDRPIVAERLPLMLYAYRLLATAGARVNCASAPARPNVL
jgi:hypothetical protein